MNIINSTCLESHGAEATIEPVYQCIHQPLSPKSIKGYTLNRIMVYNNYMQIKIWLCSKKDF